ncbi:MAG: leucine-rich repeat domain-containing protein [Ruminiclostridium sp.]|nr:leucine-rich repeat domain-containing protein [Ruminiclostridium sp.]
MLCENCREKLPIGRVVCPGCGHLNSYNIKGYSNTAAVQTALKTMISEQYGAISDIDSLAAVMRDYLPDYDDERRLLEKALYEGVIDEMILADNKKAAFNGLRRMLVRDAHFSGGEAEVVLSCFGQMFGFAYVSAMYEFDRSDEQDKKDRKPEADVPFRPKIFGKLEAIRFALSGRITVKEGYNGIAGYCFENYGLVKEISLPSTLSAIGEYAFSDCKSLTGIKIPEQVRKLEKGLFNACVGLRKVSLPDGLLAIGDNCFFCCTSLKALRIPDSVSSIGENAFSGCAALEMLVIPKNVKFIDSNAFAYCGKLTVICTENSFVHKYCMQNEIKYRTLPMGMKLPSGEEVEGELDE